ncbi:hypothetical protein Plec18167_005104 [Paecilomyces lecythidis]|uniref:Kinesin light chain n=1 Tax=Paecilomyces lecythidis TaxID=3004212 RepID=A0ABR3XL34_9EURO
MPGARVALVGLGGVGKSQVVIEYSYRIRKQSPETWVFWVHASNQARFEQSYWDIADRVKISGRKDPNVGIFKLVHDWLCEEKFGRWILILDNIDDARFLEMPPPTSQSKRENDAKRPLLSYLPVTPHGSIIVTSCNKAAASRIVEDNNILTVEPMDGIQAPTLFQRTLRNPQSQEDINEAESQEDINELVAALEYMPLAIVQAASYIRQRAQRYSVKQYLAEFQRSDRKKIDLLDRGGGELRRDREAKNSIILTWQISFDYIREIRPSAADLLSLMSFFDRQGIADYLLREPNESRSGAEGSQKMKESMQSDSDPSSDDESSSVESDKSNFEDDIVILKNYSFISSTNSVCFEMHRLVQLSTQKWLEAHGQLERWRAQFLKNLLREFPTRAYENWEKSQLLFPHAQSALMQNPGRPKAMIHWVALLTAAALFALEKGRLVDFKALMMKMTKTTKRTLGPKLEGTINGLWLTSSALAFQGKLEESEKICRQILTYRNGLGDHHPDLLATMKFLGVILDRQGKYDESEQIYRQMLAVSDDLDTETCRKLAFSLVRQEKYDEAQQLYRQVLEAEVNILGNDHPVVLASMDHLGSVLIFQEKYDEAEHIYRQIIATGERVLGFGNPYMQTYMGSFAAALDRKGNFEEAEAILEQVLALSEEILGIDHPDTLERMEVLAYLWAKYGRTTASFELLRRCIEIREKLGPDNPCTR